MNDDAFLFELERAAINAEYGQIIAAQNADEAIQRQRMNIEMSIEYWRIEDNVRGYFKTLIAMAKSADDFIQIKSQLAQYEPLPDDPVKRFKHYQNRTWSNL